MPCFIKTISPGLVDTDMVPDVTRRVSPMLTPEEVSAAVLYVLGTPSHIQISEVIMRMMGERI